MPDLSRITLPSGSTYDLKDATARQMISQLNQFEYEVVASLPTASADTMYKIYLVSADTPGTYDTYEEYITIDKGASADPRYVWEKFGTITPPDLTEYAKVEDLGDLAWKDTATGSVEVPKTYTTTTTTATTSSESVSVTGTTAGSVNVTKSAVEITPASTGTSANKYTPAGTNASSAVTGSCAVTASGSISVGDGTANYTPAGSVSIATAGSTTTIKNPTANTVVTDMSIADPGAAATGELVYCSVTDETLSLKKFVETTGDSITTSDVTVKNGDAAYTFSGTGADLQFTGAESAGTISGTAAAQTFTGVDTYFKTASDVATAATFTGATIESTGTVNVPGTFTSTTTTDTTETKTVTVS